MNSIAFHPVHGTLSTVGSDGRFSFWDKDARTKLKTSEQLDQPISSCGFNAQGNIFGYASSYDWSKVVSHVQLFFFSATFSPCFRFFFAKHCHNNDLCAWLTIWLSRYIYILQCKSVHLNNTYHSLNVKCNY